jgi:hypothetical protein
MSEANSLILLPDGEGISAGEQVAVLVIDPDQLSSDESIELLTGELSTGELATERHRTAPS